MKFNDALIFPWDFSVNWLLYCINEEDSTLSLRNITEKLSYQVDFLLKSVWSQEMYIKYTKNFSFFMKKLLYIPVIIKCRVYFLKCLWNTSNLKALFKNVINLHLAQLSILPPAHTFKKYAVSTMSWHCMTVW